MEIEKKDIAYIIIIILISLFAIRQYVGWDEEVKVNTDLYGYTNTLETRLDKAESMASFYRDKLSNDSISNRMKDSIILIKFNINENKINSVLNDSNAVNDYYEKLRASCRIVRK